MEPEVLEYLERIYLTTVLNDCLDQLSVLGRLQLSSKDRGFSPEEGLRTMEQEDIEELENKREENRSLHMWQKETNLARPTVLLNTLIAIIWDKMKLFKKMTKLGREHKLLELLIIATRDEIEKKGTFPCLIIVISERKLRRKIEDIRAHTVKTGKRVVELSLQCAHLAEESHQDWEKSNEIVGILNISKETLNYRASFKFAREKMFCDTHVEQQLKKMLMSYDGLVEEFNSTEDDQNAEDEATKSVCTFLNRRHAKLEEMLEYWMDQYERHLEDKQKSLENLRLKRSQQWDRTFHLLRQYSNDSNILDDYKAELLEMDGRVAKEKCQGKSTVIIQAWWRGLMVQHHLGPYRAKVTGK